MEEDIKILEEFIKDYEATTDPLEQSAYFEEVPVKTIRNIINKYKEQEKIIELMANFINNITDIDEDICKVIGDDIHCTEYNKEGKCVECTINYFKKKASEENG